MQLGFNQNVNYKGTVYHVQTEDGGKNHPMVTTLVFIGGNIIASKKTSYADIIKSEKLDLIVKDLIKEQHAGVVKEVLSGAFAN